MRSLYRLIVFGIAFISSQLMAQSNEVRISGTRVIAAGETFSVSAGTTIVLESGASLLVDGSIKLNGSSDKRIKIISADSKNPGLGISIEGVNESGKIEIENVDFIGLVQPLRFDPFWYRKSVEISNSNFSDVSFGEPIIYVSAPLLDLRDGKTIDFKLKNSKFFNNSDNIILEKVGSAGIRYELDAITLNDNSLHGEDGSMGMLHLDLSKDANQANISLGNFVIVNNTSGMAPIGISVSGGPGDKLNVPMGNVYSNVSANSIVYDSRRDKRLPSLGLENTSALSTMKTPQDFVLGANHTFGRMALAVSGNPTVVKLVDTFDRPVYVKQDRIGDSLIVTYLEGNPAIGTLQNGVKFKVPALTAKQLPPPLYRKIDTTLISRDTSMLEEEYWRVWKEYGMWAGGAIYQGDIKHKYFIMPSTIEISTGLYYQWKYAKRAALRFSYYNTKISMHYIKAPGLFSGMSTPYLKTTDGGVFQPSNIWRFNFMTQLNILDVEWQVFLNQNRRINYDRPNKWSILSSVGFGLSGFKYDPYRLVVTMGYNLVPLRPIGTEGQNFLPDHKPYSKFSGAFNLSYNLTMQKGRWIIKGEFKKAFAFTDYLDDYGSGKWFGGDFDQWKASMPLNPDPQSNGLQDLNYVAGMGEYYQVEYMDKKMDLNQKRSLTPLPDGYFQFHLGVAYRIVDPKWRKKAEPELLQTADK